jgi:hypothetical protein
VLLDYRAYDTLGEATVLFCAALGTVAILRRRGRSGDGTKQESGKAGFAEGADEDRRGRA